MKVYTRKKALLTLLAGLVLFILSGSIFGQNMFRKMNDFDGDGKTDFAITRTGGDYQVWYILQSRDGFKSFYWGSRYDTVAPGDYDGDGKTDIAVFRPVNFPPFIHYFWIWNSGSNNFTQIGFETPAPPLATMQQDYSGDGKTDPAIWIGSQPPNTNPTNVLVKYSGTTSGTQFQIPYSHSPLRAGDLTGDGRADMVHSVSDGISITDIATGANRIVSPEIRAPIVRGDFDGDGTGDVATWRSSDGMWWWLRSSDNTTRQFQWGTNGDVAVPGDYDGDGKTDVAIWRPGETQSYYWVYGSQSGSVVVPWGISTDKIVEP